VHQVGDQPRLYYDAWSTNHYDRDFNFRKNYSMERTVFA